MNRPKIVQIKEVLEEQVGNRVQLQTNRGRKKVRIAHGVITEAYPSLFVVKVDDGAAPRNVSFSYADVLTKAVIVTFEGETENNILS
ncbi:Veg family protein [Guggenheimella bovis]